jgi:hypothetical protein
MDRPMELQFTLESLGREYFLEKDGLPLRVQAALKTSSCFQGLFSSAEAQEWNFRE